MRRDVDAVRTLRDRVRAVLAEDLSDDHLRPIYTQVRAEWIALYPHTEWIVTGMERAASGPRAALQTLATTMDRFCDSQDMAESYRAEKVRIEGAAEKIREMLAGLNLPQ
jgi:hypothetical protein